MKLMIDIEHVKMNVIKAVNPQKKKDLANF